MKSAARRRTLGYLGFASPQELKHFVCRINAKVIGNGLAAIVRDGAEDSTVQLYLLVRGRRTERLYVILPDSKGLVLAKYRQERNDLPFLFEVLA